MLIDTSTISPGLARIRALDLSLCRLLNRINSRDYAGRFFSLISRLGDGVFWYLLMLIIPLLHGFDGLAVSIHMGVSGLVCLIVYKWLKARTSRPRPFMVSDSIIRRTSPLDEYSFPSGHTLHAVAFSLILVSHLPEWLWVVVPFTVLVAVSRPVLGLHYPSDVLAGAMIGAVIAVLSILLVPIPAGLP
jgi:undecaprenyl-diphosphatase